MHTTKVIPMDKMDILFATAEKYYANQVVYEVAFEIKGRN